MVHPFTAGLSDLDETANAKAIGPSQSRDGVLQVSAPDLREVKISMRVQVYGGALNAEAVGAFRHGVAKENRFALLAQALNTW